MKQAISSTEYHYGRDMSLSEAVQTVLDGSMQPVQVRDGRFVTVSGSNGPYLARPWLPLVRYRNRCRARRILFSSHQRRTYANGHCLFPAVDRSRSIHGPAS